MEAEGRAAYAAHHAPPVLFFTPASPQLVWPQQRDSAAVEADVAERGEARKGAVDVLAAGAYQAGERRLRQRERALRPGQVEELARHAPGDVANRQVDERLVLGTDVGRQHVDHAPHRRGVGRQEPHQRGPVDDQALGLRKRPGVSAS